jgi:hypothetical protein
MRMLVTAALAFLAVAGCARSPAPYDYGSTGYRYYGSSAPDERFCEGAGLIGGLAGAAGGGLLGNQFGHGTGKGVASGAGVVAGGAGGYAAGRAIEGC